MRGCGAQGILRWAATVAAAGALTGCDVATDDERADEAFCTRALAAMDAHLGARPAPVTGTRYGGTVVVGAVGEIADGMNALVSADYAANQHHQFVNLMTLVRFSPELEPEPYLARSWEFSPDGTELTFHLREDVLWHDGTPTTAHDVAFTFRRATDPDTGFPNGAYWTYYDGGVEVVDSFTVRFGLTPHAEPLDPWRAMGILPEHLLGEVPADRLREHPYGSRCPVGNGPFRFIEHRSGDRWVFQANTAFPEELGGRPYLDRYVYRVIPEMTTLLAELLSGGVDVFIGPSPDQARAIQESDRADFLAFPFRTYLFVGWNTRDPRLADPRVRRAMTMATNRQEMVEALLGGYGQVANAGVPPSHWAYHPGIEEALPFDPDAARTLLDEAGWIDRNGDGVRENEEGVRLSIMVEYNQGEQVRQSVAEILQARLSEVGIEIRPRVVEWASLAGRITAPDRTGLEGFVVAWVPEFRVDDRDLFHSEREAEAFGWAGIRDPRMDALLDTLQIITDREDALPVWREYQELVAELQPYLYLFFRDRLVGVSRRMRDVHMDARGEWVGLSEWWIEAEGGG